MDYNKDIVAKGDAFSKDLGNLVALTCAKNPRVFSAVNFDKTRRFYKPPEGYDTVSMPIVGNPEITDPYDYAHDFVLSGMNQMADIGIKPIAYTNVLEMGNFDNDNIAAEVKRGLFIASDIQGREIWLANGETAGLGSSVQVPCNLSGMMFGIVKKGTKQSGRHIHKGTPYIVHKHEDGDVYTFNSDGNGTKVEWNERLQNEGLPFAEAMIQDGTAMLWDDAIKAISGKGRIIHDVRVIEIGSNSAKPEISDAVIAALNRLQERTGVQTVLKVKYVGDRISGYGKTPFNMSGTTVSIINEDQIYLQTPKAGQTLLGFYNENSRNLRANGISEQRETLAREHGPDWHKEFPELLKQVSTPSTVFYPFFREMFARNLVAYVGHLSGGAYDGKLAKQLGAFGLGGQFHITTPPFFPQEILASLIGKDLQYICGQQPYRMEAWATTDKPALLAREARSRGYGVSHLGTIKKMKHPETSITFSGRNESVSYSGKHHDGSTL